MNDINFITNQDGTIEQMTEQNTLILWLDDNGNILKIKSGIAYMRYRRAQWIKAHTPTLPLSIKYKELRKIIKLAS